MHILAIDLGTTSNRVLAIDESGSVSAIGQREFAQSFPKPGWVEHDPLEILSTTQACLDDVLKQVSDVQAIGLTNQRETIVAWDKRTGKPIYPAIVWQCRRTADFCQQLAPHRDAIKEKTGLFLDPYFSASKLRWILNQYDGDATHVLAGTVDTWVLWHLTGHHVTDTSNASRTMLIDLRTGQWDSELLDLFEIPRAILPEIHPSNASFGSYRGIPITGVLGDQQAAFFAQGGFRDGIIKNTYGTGLFLMSGTGDKPAHTESLISTVAWQLDDQRSYALEGSVFIGGAIIQWLRDGLQMFSDAADSESLATDVTDNAGVYLVPALTGLGAPYWQPHATGLLTGLTRGTTTAHVTRAALESMTYQTVDIVAAMIPHTGPLTALRVDGGATSNAFLMQFQADMLNTPVQCASISETTALGAAFMAGLGAGIWSLDNIAQLIGDGACYTPTFNDDTRQSYLSGWRRAVGQCLHPVID